MKLEYDTTKYKAWTWKTPIVLPWIINPGVAFNELVLGQRIPKIMLIERYSNKPIYENSFVPCPHCGTLHDGRVWSSQNKTAFKNWFGYYCPKCGEIIPCLWNLTSLLILTLTSPIWFWFKDSMKARWLSKQKKRFESIEIRKPEWRDIHWLKMGLGWGLFMLIFMTLIDIKEFNWINLLISVPVWFLAGLAFGYSMKYFMGKKGKAEKPA